MSKSTLSSVVSTLVRASVGTSVSSTVPDEDLDKHVADLILKEAKQKAENYSKLGIKAYLPAGYAVHSDCVFGDEYNSILIAQTQMPPVPTSVSFRPSFGAPMITTRLYCVHRRSQLKRQKGNGRSRNGKRGEHVRKRLPLQNGRGDAGPGMTMTRTGGIQGKPEIGITHGRIRDYGISIGGA